MRGARSNPEPREWNCGSIPPCTGSSVQHKPEVHWADKDHVWIDGKQYISLWRVSQMLEESKQSRKAGEITIGVSIDTTEIDEALIKARELKDIISGLNKGVR